MITPRKVRFVITGYIIVDAASDEAAYDEVHEGYSARELIENADSAVCVDLDCCEDA
jgi:hypothetical protein